MAPWKKTGISSKWPAARAIGPDVTIDQALEFIWRTDQSLQRAQYSGNDKPFRVKLSRWLGEDTEKGFSPNRYEREEKRIADRGQFSVGYFNPSWTISSYIGGPHGLVAPWGKVELAQNFGKWPSIEEIEDNLNRLTSTFPWLKFTLGIWDEDRSEDQNPDPDFAWQITGGAYERVEASLDIFEKVPKDNVIENHIDMILTGTRSERTWEFDDLTKLFQPYRDGEIIFDQPNPKVVDEFE